MQNAFVESFNGRLRDECLNEHIFGNLAKAGEGFRYYPAPMQLIPV